MSECLDPVGSNYIGTRGKERCLETFSSTLIERLI